MDREPGGFPVAVICENRSSAHIVWVDVLTDLGGRPEYLDEYMEVTYGSCTWMVVEHVTVFGRRVA